MSLKPQVFPVEDIKKAGLLEKQNRDTIAAVKAASFVEGFTTFDAQSKDYTAAGPVLLIDGSLKGRTGQYIQFVGNVYWHADTASANLTVSLYVGGNNQPTFSFAKVDKQATASTSQQTISLHAFYRLPMDATSIKLIATVDAGTGTIAQYDVGYFRFSGGPT